MINFIDIMDLNHYIIPRQLLLSCCILFNKESNMIKFVKLAMVAGILATLTACTGKVENKKNNCSYDYLLHPAISISKIIGGCGPVSEQ